VLFVPFVAICSIKISGGAGDPGLLRRFIFCEVG
jgi:hypothetical protein